MRNYHQPQSYGGANEYRYQATNDCIFPTPYSITSFISTTQAFAVIINIKEQMTAFEQVSLSEGIEKDRVFHRLLDSLVT